MATRRGRATPQLQVLRLQLMLKQYELAQRAGVSANVVCRAERGDVVAFDTVKKLATALNVSADELCQEQTSAPAPTAQAAVS